MPQIGYKVLTRNGLKGPFQKSSILKAITSAQIPLQARLLDLQTGRYLSAAELVGEQAGPRKFVRPLPQHDPDLTMPASDKPPTDDSDELRLDQP